MDKNSPNMLTMIGAVLCLVSMLLGYVEFDAIFVSVPISWASVARYANNLLYVIPVIGVLMLLAGLVGVRQFTAVVTVGAAAVCIWYLFAHRDILNGDAMRWLLSANTLLAEFVEGEQGINMEDVNAASVILGMFLKLGWGYVLFVLGTLMSIAGIFIDPVRRGSGKKKSRKTHSSATKEYQHY